VHRNPDTPLYRSSNQVILELDCRYLHDVMHDSCGCDMFALVELDIRDSWQEARNPSSTSEQDQHYMNSPTLYATSKWERISCFAPYAPRLIRYPALAYNLLAGVCSRLTKL
jgi:hypothetical protein